LRRANDDWLAAPPAPLHPISGVFEEHVDCDLFLRAATV
jgi:hypothetical protein